MPIPKEILAVERPKNTRVKKNGNKYDVIKRTSIWKNGKAIPVELGKIGEIINFKYVETKPSNSNFALFDIKQFGRTEIAYKLSKDIYGELCKVFDISDAKTIYTIAIIRAAYGNVTNKEINRKYQYSFFSEQFPGVSLSVSNISKFLDRLGRKYKYMKSFIQNRMNNVSPESTIVIDGMFKSLNSRNSSFTRWSWQTITKGAQNICLLYAFDLNKKELIGGKVLKGNTVDLMDCNKFISYFSSNSCLILGDKGMVSQEGLNKLKKSNNNLKNLFPIERNDKRIKSLNLSEYDTKFNSNHDLVLSKRNKISDNEYLYSFKSMSDYNQERKIYLNNTDKNNNSEELKEKENQFGTIHFVSDEDLSLKQIYDLYKTRWEIEDFLNFYKNIIELDFSRLQKNTSIVATEFINLITTIITSRMKKEFEEKGLTDNFSFNQIMERLGSANKYFDTTNNKWHYTSEKKYTDNIVDILNL
ncbi:transposase [Mycoplasma cottewii]|uniref:Transposase n=1 Tax=Mycoplasma cottewii TaxID=51364 RepID=A0ABY5TW63_9MOLU|nr:transposase [Mycoplasma cottewii]UWD34892.1 transposase [Mycoplasma cottewii]